MPLAFEALYFPERLKIVNPLGDVGIATLWTPTDTAMDFLRRLGVDLEQESSRVAVVANLYGDGLPQMIRNLLWNPQIRHLLVFGQDMSGSAAEIESLLTKGVEPAERMGQQRYRIVGTERYLDTQFDPALLAGQCSVARFGKPSLAETKDGITAFFAGLPPVQPPLRDRVEAPLPSFKPNYFPSEPRGHVVVRRGPLDAWEEIVFRIMRFGIPSVASGTKKRLELQNLKVVVTDPVPDADEHLRPYGFSLAEFAAYQQNLLNGELPETLAYSYGNRLRGYWRDGDGGIIDTLTVAAEKLRADPTSRGAYITLWDPSFDMVAPETQSTPCLVTLFFRVFQDRLTLSATFRAHNTMSAWLKNLYGLMAVQRLVAELAGNLPLGAITVISHSISIDPGSTERFDLAQQIKDAKKDDLELDRASGKRELREDSNGYFTFTIDDETAEIVADLKSGGETLVRYRGRTAQDIESQIARDCAISELSHALYVGRQLAIHEALLKAKTHLKSNTKAGSAS